MVTTNCRELTGQGECTVPLSGNSFDELKNTVFGHAQQHHADQLKSMTPQEQSNIVMRIQQIWNQKSAAVSSR